MGQKDFLSRLSMGAGCNLAQKRRWLKEDAHCHLPGAAMMAIGLDDLFPFDDDWRGIAALRTHSHHLYLTREKA
jgi:hypothetical protein